MSERSGDGYTDHERWLRSVAPLLVAYEASDDGDSTEASIVARYLDKPLTAPVDADEAVRWAVGRLDVLAARVRTLEATVEAMNEARVASGSLAVS